MNTSQASSGGHQGDALLAGASGLIGHELAAQWPGPGRLHLLLRRAPSAATPKPSAQPFVLVDFKALPALPAAEVAFCCLGTTIAVAGSQAAFRAVDFDAVLAYAQAARSAGVRCFAVVSALGASPAAGSFYNRVKGEMEAAICTLGFDCVLIARPSLLAGKRAALDQPSRLGERLALALTAPLSPFIPLAWRPIQASTVARALLRAAAQARPGVHILESARLQELGRAESA
jgi:uncharacterized protein YbjT (DUF2867 family)